MARYKAFIDTNILLYSMDAHDARKRRAAREVIKMAHREGNAVISTQVLQELYTAGIKKLNVEPVRMKQIMNSFSNLEILTVTFPLIKEAIDTSVMSLISFWDALIVVSAEQARCDLLYTEDLKDGQIIRGVRITNPFKNA